MYLVEEIKRRRDRRGEWTGRILFFGLEKALIDRVVDMFGLASEKKRDRPTCYQLVRASATGTTSEVDPRERHDTRLSARVLRSVGAITAGCGT
jgi:hypothetical protein